MKEKSAFTESAMSCNSGNAGVAGQVVETLEASKFDPNKVAREVQRGKVDPSLG